MGNFAKALKLGTKNNTPNTSIFFIASLLNPLIRYIIDITNTAAISK